MNENSNFNEQDNNEEDLGNYITQVVTDIGTRVNTDLINKITQVPMKSKFEINGKKPR